MTAFSQASDRSALAAQAQRGFVEAFGSDPTGVWSAPGRVNLIGEHTDYNDGFAMPFALDRRTYAAIRLRTDASTRCISDSFGSLSTSLDDVSPENPPQGWAAYPLGVAWALRAEGIAVPGFDLYITSTVPGGAGVSSSAALECSVAIALAELCGATLNRRELAAVGRRAENEIAAAPTGVMDQMASLLAEPGHALLLDCRSLDVEQVPFQPSQADLTLLVIDTKVKHALVGGEYGQRRQSCEEAAQLLGVPALRDATDADVVAASHELGPLQLARARHVVTENARVQDAARLLREGQLRSLGGLLSASHASLRDDFEVSCPELDSACASAEQAGALGARMTGGGFGGSAIALVPSHLVDAVAEAVIGAAAAQGYPSPEIFPALPSAAAGRDL